MDQIANRLVDLLGGDSEKLRSFKCQMRQPLSKKEDIKILISDLGLTNKIGITLYLNAGITNLADLSKYNKDEVMNFRGMGKKSLNQN